jgi:hypothetical protein
MKKILAIMALASAGTAFAADYVSVTVDAVTNRATGVESTAQYVRAGKEIDGVQYGLTSRTARNDNGTGLFNSLETTVGKNLSTNGVTITPYVGVAYDNSKNGAGTPYYYGLVGVNAGTVIGPGYALTGVKTRVLTTAATETQQTVVFAQYAYPIAKKVSLVANVGYSWQDIKERSYGLGISVGF